MPASPEIVRHVIDTYRQAAEANRRTAGRDGNVVHITSALADEVMVAGDLHGHRVNFNRLCRVADLGAHTRRHLVLQEVCHGGPTYPDSFGCMSHLLLEDVAALKLQYRDRFHFLVGNHEMAELSDHLIAKGGKMLNMQFRAGLHELYGDAAEDVRQALMAFLATCPLAVRVERGAFLCHSIPEQVDERGFDTDVFRRELTLEDQQPGGAAFRLVWGRDFRAENAEAFARLIDAQLVIQGHEPCAEGFALPNRWQIILDCAGRRAAYAILPVGQPLEQDQAAKCIRGLSLMTSYGSTD